MTYTKLKIKQVYDINYTLTGYDPTELCGGPIPFEYKGDGILQCIWSGSTMDLNKMTLYDIDYDETETIENYKIIGNHDFS